MIWTPLESSFIAINTSRFECQVAPNLCFCWKISASYRSLVPSQLKCGHNTHPPIRMTKGRLALGDGLITNQVRYPILFVSFPGLRARYARCIRGAGREASGAPLEIDECLSTTQQVHVNIVSSFHFGLKSPPKRGVKVIE